MCSFWFCLMRCMAAFATDTGHGDLWALLVHFYVREPCVSDIVRSTVSGTRRPVVEGAVHSSWVAEETGSWECSETGGWGCWAAGEHLLPAGSWFPLVTFFHFHSVNDWWLNRQLRTWAQIEASINPTYHQLVTLMGICRSRKANICVTCDGRYCYVENSEKWVEPKFVKRKSEDGSAFSHHFLRRCLWRGCHTAISWMCIISRKDSNYNPQHQKLCSS